jgi:RNA polymerase sigma-70 factor (ECF subfamily)
MESLSNGNGKESRPRKEGISYFSKEEDVEHYRGMVFQFVLKNLEGNTNKFSVAEEITQDTMLLAWKNRGNFKGDSDFTTWLFKIAINSINSYFRYRKAVRFPDRNMSGHTGVFSLENDFEDSEDADGYERPGMVSSLTYDPQAELRLNEEEDLYIRLISDFSATIKNPMHKEIFLLGVQGFGPLEISERLSVTENAAKIALFRLRKKLVEYAMRKNLLVDRGVVAQIISGVQAQGKNSRRKNNNNENGELA